MKKNIKQYIMGAVVVLLICAGLFVYKKVNDNKSAELYDIFIENVEVHNTSFTYQGAPGIKIKREKIIEKMGVDKRYIAYNIDYYSYTYTNDGFYSFKIFYMMDADELLLVKKRADEIAQSLNGTTYEKVKWVHDYLVGHCEYDTVRPGPYNCLYGGRSNCTGFSLSFQYIMDAAGIPCKYITDSDHAWNVVDIDGVWFNIDVTYDDTSGYDFFLKSNDDWKEHSRSDGTANFSFTGDKEDLAITDVKAHNTKMFFVSKGVYLLLVAVIFVAIFVHYMKNRNTTPAPGTAYLSPVRKSCEVAQKVQSQSPVANLGDSNTK